MEVWNLIIQAVSSLGFPIAVTIWLLWERKSSMDKLTEAIANNTKVVEILCDKIDRSSGKEET